MVALTASLGFGAQSASAETQCFNHEAWFNDGPGGHGSADGASVTLNPFNPAWQNAAGTRHWESITLYGQGGLVFTQYHPAPGTFPAPGGKLTGFTVCKGDEVEASSVAVTPTTTTTVAATTTVAPPAPPAVAAPPAETTTTVPGETTTTGATSQRLPATGRNEAALLAAAGTLLVIGSTLVLVRRRPA